MIDLKEFTVSDVAAALERGGYPSGDILNVEFLHMNDRLGGTFKISYEDIVTGETEETRCYIYFNRNGVLIGDF